MSPNEAASFVDRFRAVIGLGGGPLSDKAIELLANMHPTFQQNVTRFCVAWLERVAQFRRGYVDERNKASVACAKAFVKAVPVDKRALPFI